MDWRQVTSMAVWLAGQGFRLVRCYGRRCGEVSCHKETTILCDTGSTMSICWSSSWAN